jgi:hypothetical protein
LVGRAVFIDVSALQERLQKGGLRHLGKETTHKAVDLRANECRRHPVRDYLEGLVWDGQQRLEGAPNRDKSRVAATLVQRSPRNARLAGREQ